MDVLAVAVHPDDETLGCGATLLRHRAAGDRIHWLIVTAAGASDYSDDRVAQQESEVDRVRTAYGFHTTKWLRFPTTRLDQIGLNDIVAAVRGAIAEIRPEVVYAPNRSDVHSDHRITSDVVHAVVKPFYMTSLGVSRLLGCEVPSETEAAAALSERAFVPNVFVDVSDTLPEKLSIMKLYQAQLQERWMPRSLDSIEAFARYRGAAIGVQYAEAFMLIREIR